MLVLATLGAPEHRRLQRGGRRPQTVEPSPPPTPVSTTRATVIEAAPVASEAAAQWLAEASADASAQALATVQRAVRAQRLATGDPTLREPALAQALVVRAGYGVGDQVADGRWTAAVELPAPSERSRRRRGALEPEARLAALLGGRVSPLVCEELALRARHDLDQGRPREGTLQLRLAIETALAELPGGTGDTQRLNALREVQMDIARRADAVLAGEDPDPADETLREALRRLEALLREHAAAPVSPST